MSVKKFYDRWSQYNQRMVDVVAEMSVDQLAVKPSDDGWPLWATIGHTAGGRVYWLCVVAGEPGASDTPFADPANEGWEDDLDNPRSADELVNALNSTWNIIEGCLERWTPQSIGQEIRREYGGTTQLHTRGSILQRLFSHDAYHCGELSQTMGIHGFTQIDLWSPAPA